MDFLTHRGRGTNRRFRETRLKAPVRSADFSPLQPVSRRTLLLKCHGTVPARCGDRHRCDLGPVALRSAVKGFEEIQASEAGDTAATEGPVALRVEIAPPPSRPQRVR